MTGILCIDKPEDFTSFDVVAKCRGITKCRKIGHGGTLDPMATGVLPLFLGRAAKAMDIMPVQDKRYTASFRLGLVTDTQDITGKVLSQDDRPVDEAALRTAMVPLRGTIQQLPPMYSAVQLDGRRLYDLARQGIVVDRPTRTVTIHQLKLVSYDEGTRSGILDVSCSKGTYVRTLVHDLGEALGCGGVLTALRRTQTLGYRLDQCVTLPQLQELADSGRLESVLLPVETAFAAIPKLLLSDRQAVMYQNGVRLDTNRVQCPPDADYVTVWREHTFLGTARIDWDADELVLEKLFCLDRMPAAQEKKGGMRP